MLFAGLPFFVRVLVIVIVGHGCSFGPYGNRRAGGKFLRVQCGVMGRTSDSRGGHRKTAQIERGRLYAGLYVTSLLLLALGVRIVGVLARDRIANLQATIEANRPF